MTPARRFKRFRPAGRVTFWALKNRQEAAQDGRSCAHIRGPLDPDLRGASPVKSHKISGAQNQEYLPALQSGPTGALTRWKWKPSAVQELRLHFPCHRPWYKICRRNSTPDRPPSHSIRTEETETILQNKILRPKVLLVTFLSRKVTRPRQRHGRWPRRSGG